MTAGDPFYAVSPEAADALNTLGDPFVLAGTRNQRFEFVILGEETCWPSRRGYGRISLNTEHDYALNDYKLTMHASFFGLREENAQEILKRLVDGRTNPDVYRWTGGCAKGLKK